MTTAEFVVGSLSGVVLVALFICIGVALYFGYFQGNQMCEYFKNSSSIITSGTHKHFGPYGKMQLVGGISFVLTFPRFFLKHGIVDTEDIENFPIYLRRKLIALQWCFIAVFSSMAVLASIWTSGVLRH